MERKHLVFSGFLLSLSSEIAYTSVSATYWCVSNGPELKVKPITVYEGTVKRSWKMKSKDKFILVQKLFKNPCILFSMHRVPMNFLKILHILFNPLCYSSKLIWTHGYFHNHLVSKVALLLRLAGERETLGHVSVITYQPACTYSQRSPGLQEQPESKSSYASFFSSHLLRTANHMAKFRVSVGKVLSKGIDTRKARNYGRFCN